MVVLDEVGKLLNVRGLDVVDIAAKKRVHKRAKAQVGDRERAAHNIATWRVSNVPIKSLQPHSQRAVGDLKSLGLLGLGLQAVGQLEEPVCLLKAVDVLVDLGRSAVADGWQHS